MTPALPFEIRSQHCWLSPERCLFWEEEKALVLSDLHFGKTGHFRKAGIPVPANVYREDLFRLFEQVGYFKPETIIFTGDLFHSYENLEHELFSKWRSSIPVKEIHLVRGNHDLLPRRAYADLDLILHENIYAKGPFLFVHDLQTIPDGHEGSYRISGHIHPGVRISGRGKQSLSFPCYYFSKDFAILPAFSKFTGFVTLEKGSDDKVFAILPGDPARGVASSLLEIR